MSTVVTTTTRRRRARKPAAKTTTLARQMPYRMPFVSGRGVYQRRVAAQPKSRVRLPSGLGSMIGGAAGTYLGGPLGGVIGSGLGHLAQGLLKHISGFGDYTVEVNSLMGLSPPELVNLSKNAVCLRHREYIGDITAAANYTVTAYDINPGLSASFPWLQGVAENFEEYMITGMIFEYKTLSADYTTASSAALGYVAMATQYNSLLPNFPDKVHLENYEFANSAKPSESFIHPIECKRSLNPVNQLYVRTGPVQANADQRLYDLGKFQIATGGNSGSGILGELWCTYEVCLFKPRLLENDDEPLVAHWQLTGVDNNNVMGSSFPDPVAGSTLVGALVGGNGIAFPTTLTSGKFLISYNVWGTAASITAPSITAASGCTILQYFKGDTVDRATVPSNSTTSSIFSITFAIEITGAAVVTFGTAGSLPTSATACDLWVLQFNDDIVS